MKFKHLFSVVVTFFMFFICVSCDLYMITFSEIYSDYNNYLPVSIDIDMEYEGETRIFNIADKKVVKEIYDAIKECKYSKATYEPISNMDLKLNFECLSSITMSSKHLFKDEQYYTNLKNQSQNIENIVIDYAKDNGIITEKTDDNEISTAEFKMRFDYGSIVEGAAELLWGDCRSSFGLTDLKAGDIVKIYYTGELYFLTTYPCQISIEGGEIVDIKVFKSNIVNFTVNKNSSGGYDIVADDGNDYVLPEYLVYGMEYTSINNIYQNLKLQGTIVHDSTDNKIEALYAIDYDPSKVDNEVSTYEVMMNYDYGTHIQDVATLLFNYSFVDIDLTKYSVNNLKAGDVVKFYYKGELDILETYPGQISLTDEQIVNVELFEANIVSFTVYQVPGGGYDIIADDGKTYKLPEYIVYGDNFTSIKNVYQNLKLLGTMVHNATDNKIVALYAIDYDPSKVDNNNDECKIVENPTTYYIDTGYPLREDAFDAYTLVTYKSELNWYYQLNKDKADLESHKSGTGFLDVISKYDTHWFDEKALIIIPLIETSGSNRHQVLSYQVEESKLKVNIKSIIPEIGTCDMAGWHIIVEINKSHLESINGVEIYLDGKIINPFLEERYLSDWFPFLKHSDVSDIFEIQWVDYKGSVIPGALQDCKFTTDSEDIALLLNYFKDFKLKNLGNVCLEPMPDGVAYDYYCFITNDGNYKIYLEPYYMKYFDTYSANFNVPEMNNYTQANNLLSHSIIYDAYYTTNETFKIDEVDYINELMIKEYTPNQYYMSDMLYIDYGIKLRIIDERHFEYGYKYYEILGNITFKDLVDKAASYSYYRGECTVTLVYPLSLEHPTEKDIIYMAGQTMCVSEMVTLINRNNIEGTDIMKYVYLNQECTIPLTNDIVIEEDLTLYISYKSPSNEDGVYC